jgi:endonuclease
MKEWLRQHPDRVPAGLDATSSTSHELRNGLKKMGWSVQATDGEVRLVVPGVANLESTVSAVLGDEESEEDVQSEVTFGLEYQLRDFLAQNLGAIPVEGRQLRLFVDSAGRDGIEFQTDVGRIDILAVDDTGAFIVFELKRARSPDRAIGQLSRYMGWVKHTIGRDQKVRGVIVAKTISESLRYAISVIPDVSLFEYEVSFHLKAVQGR